jgi:hypothetical protein
MSNTKIYSSSFDGSKVLLATSRNNSTDIKAVFIIINCISLLLQYHQVSKALADNRIEGQILQGINKVKSELLMPLRQGVSESININGSSR